MAEINDSENMDTIPAPTPTRLDDSIYKDKVGLYFIPDDAFKPVEFKTDKFKEGIKKKLERFRGFFDEPRVEGLCYLFNFCEEDKNQIGLGNRKTDEETLAKNFFDKLEKKRYCSFSLLKRYSKEIEIHCPKPSSLEDGFFKKFQVEIFCHLKEDWLKLDEKYGKEVEMYIQELQPNQTIGIEYPLCMHLEARKLLAKWNLKIDYNSEDWKSLKDALFNLDSYAYNENVLTQKALELQSCTSFLRLIDSLEKRKLDWTAICKKIDDNNMITINKNEDLASSLRAFFKCI